HDDHQHGADGTSTVAASMGEAAAGGVPTSCQACANHDVLSLGRCSSNRLLWQRIFANRISSRPHTEIGFKCPTIAAPKSTSTIAVTLRARPSVERARTVRSHAGRCASSTGKAPTALPNGRRDAGAYHRRGDQNELPHMLGPLSPAVGSAPP